MLAGVGYKLTEALAKKRRVLLRKGFGSLAGAVAGLAISVVGALLHVLMLGMPVSTTIERGGTFGALAGWLLERVVRAVNLFDVG